MAQRAHKPDEGFDIIVGSLVIVVAVLVLASLAGGFGRTHTISQDTPPVWSQASWQK